MKKLCLIYANCQNALITKYLSRSKSFNQEYLIRRFPIHQLIQKKTTIPDKVLKQAKLFIYQPVKDIHGNRSTQHILSKLASDCQCISFPPLYFKGYFPQYCKNPVNKVINPNYPFGIFPHGDINIISMLEQGRSVAEIIDILSDPDFYSQDFLLTNLNETLEELARRESQLSVKVSDFIKENYQQYYLFHTQNHPTDILGIYVVNQILQLINMPGLGEALLFKEPRKGKLDTIQIPIYPSVIKQLNLSFVDEKTVYKHIGFCTNKMTFARYIDEYISLHYLSTKNANPYHFQSINLTKKRKFAQAIAAQKNAIKLRSDNAAYYGELGSILQKQKKLDQAEIVYKKAIELSPDWAAFYKSLGDILIEKNNLRAATLAYKQAIILDADNDEFYCSLGDTLLKQNELDLAEIFYKKAIENDSSVASYYCSLGDIFKRKNNLDLAIVNYRNAIALAPSNGWLYIRLSTALAKQNKLDEAIDTYQQATKLEHQIPNVYINLGDLQLQMGDIDSALNTYQQAIKLNPNQIKRIFTHLGNILQEKAEKQGEKAIVSVV